MKQPTGIRRIPLARGKAAGRRNNQAIDERKRAEAELAEKSCLLDLSNDAIIVRDLHGKISLWNLGAQKMFGWTSAEVIGQDLHALLGMKFSKPREEIAKFLQRDGFFAGEVTQTARDGRQVQTLCRLVLDRQTHSVLSRFTDVSAVTRAQQAVSASEQKYRTLFEAMDEGYCIVELLFDARGNANDYRFLNVNAAFISHSGLPDPTGKRILELVPEFEPMWFEAYGKIVRTGEALRLVEYSSAFRRWFDLYAYQIGGSGSRTIAIHFQDITARKQAEQDLRESDERVRLATHATGVGIWEWNVATTEIHWDAEMFRIFGVEPTADGIVPYSAWKNAVLPEELAEQESILQETLHRGGRNTREFRILRANDGQCRQIQGVETVRKNASGEVEWVTGTNLDVTERKQAEQALVRSKQRIEDILASTTDGFFVIDSDWRFTEFNTAARRKFAEQGMDSAALIGKHLTEDVFPDASEMPSIRALCRTMTERVFTEEEDYYAPWQTWFSIRHFPTPDGGVASFFQDITARKHSEEEIRESEERFRAAAGIVTSIIWTNSGEGMMEGEQISWENFTGQSQQEYQNFGWTAAVHPDDTQPTLDAWKQALAEKRLFEFEHRVRRRDGEWRLCAMRVVPLFHGDGTIREWVGVHTDITESKRAEEAMLTLNQELESRVAARTAELRAAVAAVETEIEKRQRLEREILEIAEREQSRLGQDLHDGLGQELAGIALLSSALATELGTTTHPSSKAAANIANYTSSAIDSARMLARGLYPIELSRRGLWFALEDLADLTNRRTGVSCELRSDGPTPKLDLSTGIHIYRIIQECIGNAIKHGKASRIMIESQSTAEGHVFAVIDNGVGFEIKPDSSGMGLHLIGYRARLIGAKIMVTRPADGGCRVICRLLP